MARKKKESDYYEDTMELLRQANNLPYGTTRLALCEEAVQLADSHNDIPLAYHARMQVVEAACFAGATDAQLVAFSWCLARYDENPEQYSGYDLLWRMKWVSDDLPNYPEIALSQIDAMLNDMERRFQAYCGSIQPVLACRREVLLMVGDLDGAKAVHKRYTRMSRCFLSNCHACELDANANYFLDVGQRAVGIRKLQQVINGNMTCSTVPARTYSSLLLPLLRVGKAEEAMAYHKKGYPMVRNLAGRSRNWGEHTLFLALTGNDAKAVKAIEKHFGTVEREADPYTRLGYLRDILVAIECLAERKAKLKLRLPEETAITKPEGVYDTAALAAQLRTIVVDLSQRFDTRNGNTFHATLVKEASDIRSHAIHLPA